MGTLQRCLFRISCNYSTIPTYVIRCCSVGTDANNNASSCASLDLPGFNMHKGNIRKVLSLNITLIIIHSIGHSYMTYL